MPVAVHVGNHIASRGEPTVPRVAICTVGELLGGVERHVLGMLGGLAARGIEPTLVLLHDGELAAQARAAKADLVVLSGSNLKIFDTARRLAHLFEQRGIEVVHVHGYKAAVFCTIARRRHRFAMVKTEHGLPEPMAGSRTRAWRDRLGPLDLVKRHHVAIEALAEEGVPPDVHLCIVANYSLEAMTSRYLEVYREATQWA